VSISLTRPRAALAAALAVSAVAAVALPSAASADPNVVNGATYTIVPTHTSGTIKFLTVSGASTSAGARIVQGSSPTQAHQRFRITQAGTTGGRPYFRIRPTHVSNMCFDVEAASLDNGARVNQFPCISGNRNQQFFLDGIFTGSTIHTITPRHSGKRLDVINASTAVGAGLQQFTNNGGRNQQFLLTRVG
jgi:hypothetical protein